MKLQRIYFIACVQIIFLASIISSTAQESSAKISTVDTSTINEQLVVDSVKLVTRADPLFNAADTPTLSTHGKAFLESFLVIAISEIGDKTFLIAAILAMTHPRLIIFVSASSALLIMTYLSALVGVTLPNLVKREYTQFLAAILFLVFGAKMMKEGPHLRGDINGC